MSEIRSLLQGITHSFVLHELQSAIDTVFDESNDLIGQLHEPPLQIINEEPAIAAATTSTAQPIQYSAPWHRWAPESEEGGLQREQQCLLGIGLMLQRAPTIVRTQSFAQKVIEWHLAKKSADSSTMLIAGANLETAIESGHHPTKPDNANVAESGLSTPTFSISGARSSSRRVQMFLRCCLQPVRFYRCSNQAASN